MTEQPGSSLQEGISEILVFGDSVMKGAVLDSSGSRYRTLPATAEKSLEQEFGLKLINRSHFGQTIERGAELIYRIMGRHPKCRTVVLEFGGNDCDHDWTEVDADPGAQHRPNTPREVFSAVYLQLVDSLRARGITPVIMNLPPIDPDRYLEHIVRSGLNRGRLLSFMGDVQMIYRFQELYSLTAERVAQKTGSCLIDVRGSFLERRDFRDLLCIDGIHPNAAGHDLIFDSIRRFIDGLSDSARSALLPASPAGQPPAGY